ncbi:MAG: hypothetical protein ACREMW_09255 [Gemmatimonadales bacterium]
MRFGILPVRLFVFALPCWPAAGPLAGVVRNLALCQHREVVHQHRGHRAPQPDAPCYCDQMTGGLHTALVATEAYPAPATTVPALAVRAIAVPATDAALPASHARGATPPLPNEPVA